MFSVNRGMKGLISLSALPVAEKACRTDSVSATTTVPGPAAANKPFLDAMLNKEEVGGGKASLGQAEGSSRIFVSPAIE